MRLLYRSHYKKKYAMVAAEIPPGSNVVDLCCGDARIYGLLRRKGCHYVGLDINPKFVAWGQRKGVDVRLWDVERTDIPQADVVCIQSALYHFIPNQRQLLERMMARARQRVIIAEPVDNWTQIGSALLHKIAIRLTQVYGQSFSRRMNEKDVDELLAELPAMRVSRKRVARELIVVIDV